MSRTLAAGIAWGLLAASVALTALAIALVQLTPPDLRSSEGFGFLVWKPGVLAFGIVGALVASRRPENPVGWLFLSIGFGEPLWTVASAYARLGAVALPGSLPAAEVVGVLGVTIEHILIAGSVVLIILLFPTGQLPSARWRPVLWIAIGSLFLMAVTTLLGPGTLSEELPIENPFGLSGDPGSVAMVARSLGQMLPAGLLLLCLPALVVRWRRAAALERAQLKWFASAAAMLAVVVALVPLWESLERVPAVNVTFTVLLLAAVAGIPVSAGIAILRHRLYDIDLIIRRTLVYAALSVVLGGAYLGFVLTLQLVMSPLTGNDTLAVAISTLAVAALFGPVRRRTQAEVDRRFYRARYDARRTVEAFAVRLRDEVDIGSLTEELEAAVRSTVRPTASSVWLRERAP